MKMRTIFVCLVWLGAFLARSAALPAKAWAEDSFLAQRRAMVQHQIRMRGISASRVLAAMETVPRHRFVPPAVQSLAYADHPLPIGEGQTISQPYIVALMTASLDLGGHEKVLEIGTGSGYQAAVLAELCRRVYTVEIFQTLGRRAKAVFQELGYDNIEVKIGDGYGGWPEHAPFDAIIVTCAPTHVPQLLVAQLAPGGKMVIPVGDAGVQKLVLLTKTGDSLSQTDVIPVRFVPMIDPEGKPY